MPAAALVEEELRSLGQLQCLSNPLLTKLDDALQLVNCALEHEGDVAPEKTLILLGALSLF